MRKSFVFLQYPRFLFSDYLYYKASKTIIKNKSIQQLIDEDMPKYMYENNDYYPHGIKALNFLLANNYRFRNVFYFRIDMSPRLRSSLVKAFSRCFVKPLHNIEISVNSQNGMIDGGLRVMHSTGCVIAVKNAGKNLSVFQGVTIGNSVKKDKDDIGYPSIGDNVCILANAVVFGGISIGNNVTIGAGSVVNKDVPDNCVIAGNPARIIRTNEERISI